MPDDLETKAAEPWLGGIGQSEAALREIWNPLSRFLLGDELAKVSASLFMRTLQRHFFTGARTSRITVPSFDVSAFLVRTLTERLKTRQVSLRLRTGVTGFQFAKDQMTAVEIHGREILSADCYIAAIPFARLRRLLPERVLTHYAYFQQLGRLQTTSMVAVHFEVAHRSGQSRLILLPHRAFHWIITRPNEEHEHDATDLYLVAGGTTGLLSLSDDTLLDSAWADASAGCPMLDRSAVVSHRVHRITDTGLSVKPGTQRDRPLQHSPFTNLFLAGDWTDTGWPANLESAVVSGNRCAAAIAT